MLLSGLPFQRPCCSQQAKCMRTGIEDWNSKRIITNWINQNPARLGLWQPLSGGMFKGLKNIPNRENIGERFSDTLKCGRIKKGYGCVDRWFQEKRVPDLLYRFSFII